MLQQCYRALYGYIACFAMTTTFRCCSNDLRDCATSAVGPEVLAAGARQRDPLCVSDTLPDER